MNNNNLYIIILLILIIFIILVLINNNFKENFICVNPTTYTNKSCKSDLKQINNPINYCNNNDKCNGYISVNIKDKFNNERTVYFKCLDNWSGELYQKDLIYNKLKKKYKDFDFSNLKTYKCNNNCPPGKGIIDDSNTCLDCPDNKYNAGDSNNCKDIPECPQGTDNRHLKGCEPCPDHQYSATQEGCKNCSSNWCIKKRNGKNVNCVPCEYA